MRELADADRISRFMEALGRAAQAQGRVYFTGGATAVLLGWRGSTIDVDIKLVPDRDELLRALPALKEQLHINIELAAPSDFIPVAPGWEDRSLFARDVGKLSFYHFDLYAQALAKVERGHAQDLDDVAQMLGRGLIERERALDYFARIEPDLYRYPAIDGPTLRRAVEATFGRRSTPPSDA